jgi:hypothetical protein
MADVDFLFVFLLLDFVFLSIDKYIIKLLILILIGNRINNYSLVNIISKYYKHKDTIKRKY